MACGSSAGWPSGSSEMARLIRQHDWSTTPLGPVTSWTSRLRLVVEVLLSNPLVAYIVCGPERILIYNDAATSMLGALHPGALGQSASTFFTEAREVVESLYDRAFTGEAVRIEAQPIGLRATGPASAFDLVLTPIPEEDGSITAVQVIGFEVSARLIVEQERDRTLQDLRASEAQLRLALDAARMGVWTYDPARNTFVIDARTSEITGVAPVNAVPAATIWSAAHPDDRADLQTRLAGMLDPQGDHWNEATARFVHPGGEVCWTQMRAQAVLEGRSPKRRTARVLGTILDTTDGKQAEAALRESEARFRAVANLGPDFLWSSDAEGRATWFSERWYAYTGQTEAAALGYGWHAVIHRDDREPTMERFREVVEQGQVYSHEYRIRGQDGLYRWFLVRAGPIHDEAGRITRCYGAVTDIDAMHGLHDRQAVLVAELQHRTRNLIAVVRSIADRTMALTSPNERFREQFSNRLAALSRVQGLLSRSDQEPITMRALLQAELDALGSGQMRARVALEGPSVVLHKDSVQTLALALHELTTNARKYGALSGPESNLRVSWDIYSSDTGDQRLALTWMEDGITGPRAGDPVPRGYGRELIEKALPYALEARTCFELGENDLRCSIDLPLNSVQRGWTH